MKQGRAVSKTLAEILKKVAIISLSAQILLGLFWTVMHFTFLPKYGESVLLQELRESLTCDEYTGILYPLLMRMASGIARVLPVPAHSLLYLGQLVAAFACAYYLLGSFECVKRMRKGWRIWMALAMLTVPVCAQCHMAVLPISFAGSLLLAMAGVLLRSKDGARTARDLTIFGIWWLLAALLLPEFYFFGAVLLILYVILALRRQLLKKYAYLLCAVFLGVIPIVMTLTTSEGSLGRMQPSVEATALKRFAWEAIADLYPVWPAELKESLSQTDIFRMTASADELPFVLGSVEKKLGKDEAKKIYGALAKEALRTRGRENLKEIAADFVGYLFAPASELAFLSGKSHTSHMVADYEALRAKSPRLTAIYLRLGNGCFLLSFLIAILLCVRVLLQRKEKTDRFTLWLLLPTAAVMLLTYTLRAGGIMDGKNTWFVAALWTAFICLTILGDTKQEN
ncbi:MAG: hypothetical protein K5678_10100 [Acetatifactor sp.]|nr:hypothetical protein [Acetatifactor sp.]